MPLSLLNHPALALFAQRTRIPTSARSIGFCAIWVCISSSSSSLFEFRIAEETDVRFLMPQAKSTVDTLTRKGQRSEGEAITQNSS